MIVGHILKKDWRLLWPLVTALAVLQSLLAFARFSEGRFLNGVPTVPMSLLELLAAATVIMSDARAKSLGLKPLARFVAYATAGVLPEEFGIGPVQAIPKALKLAGLSLNDWLHWTHSAARPWH